ncbi:DUF1015 domain-containing protein [Microaceticoccus formicicus]|uniref:DUF1015 domain-containing protein n=1 Tax=Microaceticoccus formicicus TaxID=3118105 RepID=UPI003CD026F1|nr:DUF1015 family protein [Peptoniphilaceae bacterium AMB_02]
MVKLRSFKAFRPSFDDAEIIAELPYDVMSTDEAREIIKVNPRSIIGIDRAEAHFDNIEYNDPAVYKKARELFKEIIKSGELKQDEDSSIYLYVQEFKGKTQKGIVALSSAEDYLNKKIKVHEKTIAEKEVDRTNHIDITGYHLGPIFLLYETNKKIENIINETIKNDNVLFDFEKNGVRNTGYKIIDSEGIIEAFNEIENTYIADGHHRSKSAINVYLKDRENNTRRESDYFLSVLFSKDDINVMAYNRYLRSLKGLKTEEVFDALRKYYEVEELKEFTEPGQKYELSVYHDKKSYKLTLKDEYKNSDVLKDLDVSSLQKYVLNGIFGIEDPTVEDDLEFVGGIRGINHLKTLVDKNGGIAFSMYPTSAEDLLSVAGRGDMMPAKSTWFEPKLLNGLFVHEM